MSSISDSTFYGCIALTSVTIPNSIMSIGSSAFASCTGLRSITIPDSVTSIGSRTFSDCKSLTSITIPSSVLSIGERAFYGCSNLSTITIPDGVSSLGEFAFFNCIKLTSIVIPSSVTSIGNSAFSLCKNLADVYYGGNESDRALISIGTSNECLTNAIWHYNSSGIPIISVTGVTVSPTAKTLAIGKTQQLTATIAPANATDKAVTYFSTNVNVATVSDTSLVKAIAAGTATITVKTSNGGKTATCTITVEATPGATVPATGVTLDKTAVTLEKGKTQKLVATVAPDTATDKSIKWTSSNPSIATVDANGLVTAIADGTATITATTANGKAATCAVTVSSVTEPTEPSTEPPTDPPEEELSFFEKIIQAIINFFKSLFANFG